MCALIFVHVHKKNLPIFTWIAWFTVASIHNKRSGKKQRKWRVEIKHEKRSINSMKTEYCRCHWTWPNIEKIKPKKEQYKKPDRKITRETGEKKWQQMIFGFIFIEWAHVFYSVTNISHQMNIDGKEKGDRVEQCLAQLRKTYGISLNHCHYITYSSFFRIV